MLAQRRWRWNGGVLIGSGVATPMWARMQKPLCRVHLGAGYSPDAGLLRVNVMEVADLVWKEDTKPDLYVKMFVAPDPKKSTKVCRHPPPGSLERLLTSTSLAKVRDFARCSARRTSSAGR